MNTAPRKTSPLEQQIASKSVPVFKSIYRQLGQSKQEAVQINIDEVEEYLTVPKAALSLFIDILTHMAAGKSVTLIPPTSELTTQQAADILHVSRPHIVKLLESGMIPFKKVGSHRRILFHDLVAYEDRLKGEREAQLQFLAKQAQELALGYE